MNSEEIGFPLGFATQEDMDPLVIGCMFFCELFVRKIGLFLAWFSCRSVSGLGLVLWFQSKLNVLSELRFRDVLRIL